MYITSLAFYAKQCTIYLQSSQGQIWLTTNLWSDEFLRSFMAVTAHYINSQGDMAEHLVAFRKVEGHHTGANIGQILFSVLDEIGIVGKVSIFVMS